MALKKAERTASRPPGPRKAFELCTLEHFLRSPSPPRSPDGQPRTIAYVRRSPKQLDTTKCPKIQSDANNLGNMGEKRYGLIFSVAVTHTEADHADQA